jgi:NADPH:quinone reductase-like Zn-dependent oxidoreductase
MIFRKTGIHFSGSCSGVMLRGQLRINCMIVGSRKAQIDIVRAVEANIIRPIIDSSFPFAELGDAFCHQKTGKHFGKIAIDI